MTARLEMRVLILRYSCPLQSVSVAVLSVAVPVRCCLVQLLIRLVYHRVAADRTCFRQFSPWKQVYTFIRLSSIPTSLLAIRVDRVEFLPKLLVLHDEDPVFFFEMFRATLNLGTSYKMRIIFFFTNL